eukprot:Hpha_TRINITY_DN15876_c0_g2::TRINITY_DN15876_c0_g2_i1::g.190912::m.190912
MAALERMSLAAAFCKGSISRLPGDVLPHIAGYLRSEPEQIQVWFSELDDLRIGTEVELRTDVTHQGFVVFAGSGGTIRRIGSGDTVAVRYLRQPAAGGSGALALQAAMAKCSAPSTRRGSVRPAALGTECVVRRDELIARSGAAVLAPFLLRAVAPSVGTVGRVRVVDPSSKALSERLSDWAAERHWLDGMIDRLLHAPVASLISEPVPSTLPQGYPSLERAIAAAKKGDTVRLPPGRYKLERTLRVGAQVTLTGPSPCEGRAELVGQGEHPVVDLAGPEAVMTHLTITKLEGGGCTVRAGSSHPQSGRPTLRHCSINGSGAQLAVAVTGAAVLEDVTMSSIKEGLRVSSDDEGGNVTIMRCSTAGCQLAVALDAPRSTILLEDCKFNGSRGSGVAVGSGTKARLYRCSIRNNTCVGVIVDQSAKVLLSHSLIEGNAGGGVSVVGQDSVLRMLDCSLTNNENRELLVSDWGTSYVTRSSFNAGAAPFAAVFEKRGGGLFFGNEIRGYPTCSILTQNGGGGYIYRNTFYGPPDGRKAAGVRVVEHGLGVVASNSFYGIAEELAVVGAPGTQVQVRWNGVEKDPSREMTVDDFCRLALERAVWTDLKWVSVLPSSSLHSGTMHCRSERDWRRREAAACFLGVSAGVSPAPSRLPRRSSVTLPPPPADLDEDEEEDQPAPPAFLPPEDARFAGADNNAWEVPEESEDGLNCPMPGCGHRPRDPAIHLAAKHGLKPGVWVIISHSHDRMKRLCGAASAFLSVATDPRTAGMKVKVAEVDSSWYCKVTRPGGKPRLCPVGALVPVGGAGEQCPLCHAKPGRNQSKLTHCCRNVVCRAHAQMEDSCPHCDAVPLLLADQAPTPAPTPRGVPLRRAGSLAVRSQTSIALRRTSSMPRVPPAAS